MLFNYETTNRTDFNNGVFEPIIHTVYKEKSGCLRIRPPPPIDIHTLSDWKNPNIPSDLLVKPKDIVRTNPKQIQRKYEVPPDMGKDEVQRTRPWLVMTGAISMDDIPDTQTCNLLIEVVYKSKTQRAYTDVAPIIRNIRAPFPELPAPANPITLEKLQVTYVSSEWRMQSARWDGAHCNPSREFYLARTLKCDACKGTAAVEARRKLMKEMKKR